MRKAGKTRSLLNRVKKTSGHLLWKHNKRGRFGTSDWYWQSRRKIWDTEWQRAKLTNNLTSWLNTPQKMISKILATIISCDHMATPDYPCHEPRHTIVTMTPSLDLSHPPGCGWPEVDTPSPWCPPASPSRPWGCVPWAAALQSPPGPEKPPLLAVESGTGRA